MNTFRTSPRNICSSLPGVWRARQQKSLRFIQLECYSSSAFRLDSFKKRANALEEDYFRRNRKQNNQHVTHTEFPTQPKQPTYSQCKKDTHGETDEFSFEDKYHSMVANTVDTILTVGVDGIGPLASAKSLAGHYKRQEFPNTESRVDSLVTFECSKTFGLSFMTGLGGALMLPVSLSAIWALTFSGKAVQIALASSWVLQARLAATIAELNGFNTDEDRVRLMVLRSLLHEKGSPTIANPVSPSKKVSPSETIAGVESEETYDTNAISDAATTKLFREQLPMRVPLSTLIALQHSAGHKLIQCASVKAGASGSARMFPLMGGVVGGSVDAASMLATSRTARGLFKGEICGLAEQSSA